jgi:hypothetical protein
MTALAQRTPVKPATGGNPADDIKIGQEVAREIEKELVLIANRDANAYIRWRLPEDSRRRGTWPTA